MCTLATRLTVARLDSIWLQTGIFELFFFNQVSSLKLQPECGQLRSSCCIFVSTVSAFEQVDGFSLIFA